MTCRTAPSHRLSHARVAIPLLARGLVALVFLVTSAGVRVHAQPAPRGDRHASFPDRELSLDEQIRHVLDRLAFGPRPDDIARVSAMGVDGWLDQQLDPARLDDREMQRVLDAYPALTKTARELMQDYALPGAVVLEQRMRSDTVTSSDDSLRMRQAVMQNRQFIGQLLSARVARAVVSERQLQEVMTDFWLNHFSVFVGKGQLRYFLADYEREAIRPHVLGRFRDLLGAVAHSPAMLQYLDNAQSVADSAQPTLAEGDAERRRRLAERAIARRAERLSDVQRERLQQLQARRPRGLNENYARELLELHTLGVDGGYTQADIIDVARALTGWAILPARAGGPEFRFNAASHDAGEKVVLGKRLPAGRGIEDGEDVLDLLARHPSTAHYIARKLATRLVSDAPPAVLVERAAETFQRTDGDLREVVRTLVTAPEFFSRSAYRSKVKSPFEVVVSAMRAVGAGADTTALTSQVVARLGQPIYGHPAPDGWPETGEEWMNTGAILARINFGLSVADNRLPVVRVSDWPRYAALRDASRDEQVEGVIDAFLGGRASTETREILLSGENPLLSDQPASDGGDAAPRRRAPRRSIGEGLDQIIGLALGSPEFQRR